MLIGSFNMPLKVAETVYSNVYRSMQNKRDLASPVSEFLGVTLVTGLLLYGGMLVLNKESSLTGVQFIAYIILIVQT